MDRFSEYWKAYSNSTETAQRPRQQWSESTLSNGIVKFALRLLAQEINSAAGAVAIQELPDGICVLESPLAWNGLRIQILGVLRQSESTAARLMAELADRARESLCFCVFPGVFPQAEALLRGGPTWTATATVLLYPDDLDALALGEWALADAVEYKLFRTRVLEKPSTEAQYDPRLVVDFRRQRSQSHPFVPLRDALAGYPDDYRRWATHPLAEKVERAVGGGRSCLLIGASSSGKTVMALEAGQLCAAAGMEVSYLNLGVTAGLVQPYFMEVTPSSGSKRRVYIVDDLQSSPQAARYIGDLVNLSRRTANELPSVVIAVSWPDFAESAAQFFEDCLPVYVRAKDIRQSLVAAYSTNGPDLADETFAAVKDDLQLLRIYLDVRAEGSVDSPTIRDVAKSYWERRTAGFRLSQPDAKRVVLAISTLGRYDVLVSRAFVEQEAQVSTSVVDELLRTGLLRLSRQLLTLGHRSLASLLGDWLSNQGIWAEFRARNGPEDPLGLVKDYLRAASPSGALETLRALQARAGFKESDRLNSRTAALVATWRAFNALLERIRHQHSNDPEWRSIPSSIMFVTQSFAEIGRAEDARASILFLRTKYNVDHSGTLHIDTESLATKNDFGLIADAIKDQDAAYAETNTPRPPGWLAATEIDADRFHKTWLAGVILCAESAYHGSSGRSLSRLADAVAREQLPSGAFYPERAAWSTARVCLGLASAGRSIHTCPTLKKAVDWLLRARENGGPCLGGLWQSGTGRWNSDLEVTAMAVLACIAAGVEPDDARLAPARKYLISQSDQWIVPGHELEGALAAQSYLEAGGAWDEIVGQVQRLSDWAQGEAFWRTATLTSTESFEQSCRVAQTAFHLLAIGWSAIRADLPILLQALDVPDGLWTAPASRPASTSPAVVAAPAKLSIIDSVQEQEIRVLEALRNFDALRLDDLAVVGNYCRFDEKVRNQLKNWRFRMSRNFETKTCGHENFLIWAAPGSGKSFLVSETARALTPAGVRFISANLAKESKQEFLAKLADVAACSEPFLCLIDEVDARADESWPYEELFSHLDRNLDSNSRCVFVLVGSARAGMNGMIQEMLSRKKGPDLLDRVPVDRRFEVPAMCVEDRAVVFSSNVAEASRAKGQVVRYIEKFGLFFILVAPEFSSPRQLRDLAFSAVGRMSAADDRLHYDNLFAVGERKNQQFWGQYQVVANELAELYVAI